MNYWPARVFMPTDWPELESPGRRLAANRAEITVSGPSSGRVTGLAWGAPHALGAGEGKFRWIHPCDVAATEGARRATDGAAEPLTAPPVTPGVPGPGMPYTLTRRRLPKPDEWTADTCC